MADHETNTQQRRGNRGGRNRVPRLVAFKVGGGHDSGGSCAAAGPTPEETEAVARFNQRDYDGALKALKAAAKKNPDLPPAQVLLAQWFAQAGLPTGVRNALEQAITEAPADPEAYIEMGDILLHEGWITGAELLYRKAGGLIEQFDKSPRRKDISFGPEVQRSVAGRGGPRQLGRLPKAARSVVEIRSEERPGDATARGACFSRRTRRRRWNGSGRPPRSTRKC